MLPSKPKIGLVILAAGASSRMNGSPKQLLEIRGKSFLRRSAEIALKANLGSVRIVLGANADTLGGEIEDLPVDVSINEHWADGISSSIRTGLTALAADKSDAALIMLCDQPLVTTTLLRRLSNAFVASGKRIAACRYADTIGVPALFASEFFDGLMNLQNDQGAKKLIKKHLDKTILVDSRSAALDIDTPQDFNKFKSVYFPAE